MTIEEIESNQKKKTKETYKEFNFKDFRTLDQSEDADYLIESMSELFSLEGIQEMKQRAIARLQIERGNKILELGCGLGDDAKLLAEMSGETGKVIAIDNSQRMLEKAMERNNIKNVFYQLGEVSSLKFQNDTFDVCHADRLLISQQDPIRVISEGLRVLKPGGRLGITDCDFGSVVFHPFYPEATPSLIKRMQEITQNPLIGRELHVLMSRCGLVDITIDPEPYIVRSFKKLNLMIDVPRILEDLARMGVLKKEIAQRQLEEFWRAEKQGEFLYCITFFTVTGKKSEKPV